MIKNGWVPKNELKGRNYNEVKFVGNEMFFKLNSKQSSTKPTEPKINNSDTTQQNQIQ
jgi:hypothetical protein